MSERDWIDAYIRPLVSAPGADQLRDDVAELASASKQIVTMDTLVEGRHFLELDPLETVGEKLIRVNVSDIYAKGALPKAALLSVAWPEQQDEMAFAYFMRGIASGLEAFSIDLIGGDFVKTPGPLVATLTLTGACIGEQLVRRKGDLRLGDRIWVSGEIGWGGVGLKAARTGETSPASERFWRPKISTAQQASLIAQFAKASMDVSDGLLIDAQTLADVNGVGFALELSDVPFAESPTQPSDAIDSATSGDDYQILCVTAPEIDLTSGGFTQIGVVVESAGLQIAWRGGAVPLPKTLGFSH